MKRSRPITIWSIDIGVSIKEELDALMMAISRCMMKRSRSITISSVDIGTSIEKELDALLVAIR